MLLGGKMSIKAVLFDNDGVIINSEPLHMLADSMILEKYGIDGAKAELSRFIGVKDLTMWEILKRELDIPVSVETLMDEKLQMIDQVFTGDNIREIKGITPLIRRLKLEKIKVGLVTSSRVELVGPWLDIMGLTDVFDVKIFGNDIVHCKPNPEPYLKAAEKLGLVPAECLAIEDSSHGIHSAKAAGCFCMAYRNPDSGVQDISKADYVVDSIEEIINHPSIFARGILS
jgi:HAD superfamily hydrolase (TIGR01509 family)